MENCDGKINEGHERTVCKKSNRWDTGKVREVRKVWNKLSTTRRTVCRKSNRWDTGNAEMDGGREEGLIMLFHMPLSRFSTIVVVILFFFIVFFSLFLVWFFIVFYFPFMIVTLRDRGPENVIPHTLPQIFNNLLLLFSFTFCSYWWSWIRWKSNTLKYHEYPINSRK